MPLYDFQCRKCSRIFEFTRAMGSKTVPACPSCKSKRAEKLMTPPAIHFKGSGWYKTDSIKPRAGCTKQQVPDLKKDIQTTAITPAPKEMKDKKKI